MAICAAVYGLRGMAQTVLVTGATGYVGGRLAPLLVDKGFNVRVLVDSMTNGERPLYGNFPDGSRYPKT